jgi:hypothetical protein
MFEVTGRPGILFSITTAATSFLHHHDLIKAVEVRIQNSCEFATIQKVC